MTLAPLGDSTDSYTFTSGAIAYYLPPVLAIHPDGMTPAQFVAQTDTAAVYRTARTCGLTHDEACALANAAARDAGVTS